MGRNREWLRGFLHLGARASDGAVVPRRDVERQEDTVLRALELLDRAPGVVLADEVGMGKTYEALGVMAARMQENPAAKMVILTPGPDLNQKWLKEITAFGDDAQPMFRGFAGRFSHVESLPGLIRELGQRNLVVAPVNMFAGSRSVADQAWLLTAWAEHWERPLAGNQIAAMFARYRPGQQRVDLARTPFLGAIPWSRVAPILPEAMVDPASGAASLSALFERDGYDAFAHTGQVDRHLMLLRFHLVRRLVPQLDMLVVDEAHKLKNPASVRATGVRTVFAQRFAKALFLTATPFQLSVDELREVFRLFALAKDAPADVLDRAEQLLAHVAEYTRTYDALERAWAQLDGAASADFAVWYQSDPALGVDQPDPTLRSVGELARQLLTLKTQYVEPGFRAWMIRSLREDKRTYRRSVRTRLQPAGGPALPFLLYERFIAELFRSRARTHKAAVQINMVSSYAAAREGALLADRQEQKLPAEAESYRTLLRGVVDAMTGSSAHPKVEFVVADALAAAKNREKTLIFCARVASLHTLKAEIEGAWNEHLVGLWRRIYPDTQLHDIFDQTTDDNRVRGRHSRLQLRFQRPLDALHLALRERYVVTLLDAVPFARRHLPEIVNRANEILLRQRVRKTEVQRTDWSLLKRCVEQATALLLVEHDATRHADPELLARLTDPEFVPLGLDLSVDADEVDSRGDFEPEWQIDRADAEMLLPDSHLWSHLTEHMRDLPPKLRVTTVERIAGYLVSRFVPFVPELAAFAHEQGTDLDNVRARALLPIVDAFWATPNGRIWLDSLGAFLTYASRLDTARRDDVLDALKAGAIVRHTVDGESRERLREAFNTPLYPMVLVANEVMQEGLDLHHHCRRVVHHDLAWNPAQLEQRVGRVDRLGSLLQRMRAEDPAVTLEILLPLIANTIDERLERTVRLRERWLEFLLGAAPRIDEYSLADEVVQPLPDAFAQALKIDLGPG